MDAVLCRDYYRIGNFNFYPSEGVIIKCQQRIKLRSKETELLYLLVQRYPNIVTRHELAEQVWQGTYVTDATINQTMKAIRNGLDDYDREIIRTIPKKGYVLGIHITCQPHPQYLSSFTHYFGTLSYSLQSLVYLVTVCLIGTIIGYLFTTPAIETASKVNGNTIYLFQPSQVEQARFDLQKTRTIVDRTAQGYRICQNDKGVLLCQHQR